MCMIFIVHTMPRRWVYLKMGLPDAYARLGERQHRGRLHVEMLVPRHQHAERGV